LTANERLIALEEAFIQTGILAGRAKSVFEYK